MSAVIDELFKCFVHEKDARIVVRRQAPEQFAVEVGHPQMCSVLIGNDIGQLLDQAVRMQRLIKADFDGVCRDCASVRTYADILAQPVSVAVLERRIVGERLHADVAVRLGSCRARQVLVCGWDDAEIETRAVAVLLYDVCALLAKQQRQQSGIIAENGDDSDGSNEM